MTRVGSYEAKTHLPQLLERVAHGEKFLITRHGQALALLVPATAEKRRDVRSVIARMRELRRETVLGPDVTVRQLIEEGRRF
jgi:prevent-host-death family protein